MSQNDIEIIKGTIEQAGYNLKAVSDAFFSASLEDNKRFSLVNTSIIMEFLQFKDGKDTVKMVAQHTAANPNSYFRQIAIGKIWLALKGEWREKDLIDKIMDKIVVNISQNE